MNHSLTHCLAACQRRERNDSQTKDECFNVLWVQETISQEMGRQAVGSSLESLIMKEWKEDQCCEEDQKIMKRKEEQERYLLITALDS